MEWKLRCWRGDNMDEKLILYQQILYDEIIQAGDRLYSGTIHLPETAPACERTFIYRCAWHTGLL